ncbi:MAG: inorganic diphosphatase [Spiroplasma sp.]|nr:inorganic diphosphatase [Spiroplasma sp.]
MDKNALTVEMIVEIPKGSKNKVEYDLKKKAFILDRPLYGANFYPGEYGYIPNTLDYDGDPLDVISLISYPTFSGCLIAVRVLGAIEMIDNGEIDTKVLAVPISDPRFNHYQTLKDVPQHLLDEITNFFLQYKALQKKKVVIKGFLDLNETTKEIEDCKMLYSKYQQEMLSWEKKDLVTLLMKHKNKK